MWSSLCHTATEAGRDECGAVEGHVEEADRERDGEKVKTFDEAWRVVIARPEQLEANLRASKEERMANDSWRHVVEVMGIELCKKQAALTDSDGFHELLTLLCSSLHAAFEVGLITGMEMEKSDAIANKS